MPPGIDRKWPKQREPSVIAGQFYPTQEPIVGVFGQQPFETVPVYAPGVVAQQKQITEQVEIQEQPELQKIPLQESIEILAAELLLASAKRSPTDWRVITYTFDGTNPQQVGRMVGRRTIVFFNGSANVTVARTIAALGTTANEQFILTTGNSASIDTEGEFYMTAVSGTTVSVMQTYYDLEAMLVAKMRMTKGTVKAPSEWNGTKSSSSAN